MVVDPEVMEALCMRAGVRGRAKEVLVLLGQGLTAKAVAERLGVAVSTVNVNAHRARKKLAEAQARWSELEFHRFVLHEAVPGPTRAGEPPVALFCTQGPRYGERVKVSGMPLTTVDDLAR